MLATRSSRCWDADPRGDAFELLLHESLALLRREFPQSLAGVERALHGRTLRLRLDGRTLLVRSNGDLRVEAATRDEDADVQLEASGATVLKLLDGELTLLDALLTDRLSLVGAMEDLQRFLAALRAYLQGMVRCPASTQLLSRYRAAVVPTDEP